MLSNPEFKKKQILFVFANNGDKISFLNDNIVIRNKDKKIKHQSTCYRLFLVFVIGNISITSGIIQRCRRFGFSLCLMTPAFRVYEIIGGLTEGNIILHKYQYEYTDIDIGKHIIINKIVNQQRALCNFRYKTELIKQAIALLEGYIYKLSNENLNVYEIMGIEGTAAKIYFSHMFNNVKWNGRRPRIKTDYVNAALDIGYSILFNFIDAILGVYGFDRYYGVFHKCFYMRKSLVCDIMEPFRPIIDRQIRKSINLNQFSEADFTIYDGRYLLPWKETPKYTSVFFNAINENRDEIFSYIQSYYRAVMKQKNAEDFPVFEMR